MKNAFVADGCSRLIEGQKAAAKAIEKKYAAELAKADPGKQSEIRARVMEELGQCKMREHKPSAGTLW